MLSAETSNVVVKGLAVKKAKAVAKLSIVEKAVIAAKSNNDIIKSGDDYERNQAYLSDPC